MSLSLSIDTGDDTNYIDAFSMALLEDCVTSIGETEEIGETVINQLRQQREQIECATGSLVATNEVTSRAHKFLRTIRWNACKEKLSLCVVILMLSLIDILMAYRIVTNRGHL